MRRLVLAALTCVSALAALGLLFAALVVWLAVSCDRSEYLESFYPTREDAEAAGRLGSWTLPERLVPESATDIREMHNIDTNYIWVRFEFEASDEPAVPQGARKLEPEELGSVEVPEAPYDGRK